MVFFAPYRAASEGSQPARMGSGSRFGIHAAQFRSTRDDAPFRTCGIYATTRSPGTCRCKAERVARLENAPTFNLLASARSGEKIAKEPPAGRYGSPRIGKYCYLGLESAISGLLLGAVLLFRPPPAGMYQNDIQHQSYQINIKKPHRRERFVKGPRGPINISIYD